MLRVPGNPNNRRPPSKPAVFDPWEAIAAAMREQVLFQQQQPEWPPPSLSRTPSAPSAQEQPTTPGEAETVHNEPEPPAAPRVELTVEDRRHFELIEHIQSLAGDVASLQEQQSTRYANVLSDQINQLAQRQADLEQRLTAPRRIVRDETGRAVGSVIDLSLERQRRLEPPTEDSA